MKNAAELMICAILLLVTPVLHASSLRLETSDLIVSDGTGNISDDRLRELSVHAQESLNKVLAFWSVGSEVARYGKIRVIFENPRRRDYYTSILVVSYGEFGRRVRTVRVFGYERTPEELVHKLTHAVFLTQDKLIRNMMGVATEEQVGNRLSWPACGFGSDEWVSAFVMAGTYIPLSDLGPDHESWGMKADWNGFPSVFDRSRQSRTYAEAGSFGGYLIRTYGIEKIKQFYDLAMRKERPWQEVFGIGMQEIEGNWLNALKAKTKTSSANVSTLSKLFERDPNLACLDAQDLVTGK
jgi:hypothetical protein